MRGACWKNFEKRGNVRLGNLPIAIRNMATLKDGPGRLSKFPDIRLGRFPLKSGYQAVAKSVYKN